MNDIFSLDGKYAVVIGGKGKIGIPMVKSLAIAGATVYVCSPTANKDEITKKFGNSSKIFCRKLDQSDEGQIKQLVNELSSLGHHPNILVIINMQGKPHTHRLPYRLPAELRVPRQV